MISDNNNNNNNNNNGDGASLPYASLPYEELGFRFEGIEELRLRDEGVEELHREYIPRTKEELELARSMEELARASVVKKVSPEELALVKTKLDPPMSPVARFFKKSVKPMIKSALKKPTYFWSIEGRWVDALSSMKTSKITLAGRDCRRIPGESCMVVFGFLGDAKPGCAENILRLLRKDLLIEHRQTVVFRADNKDIITVRAKFYPGVPEARAKAVKKELMKPEYKELKIAKVIADPSHAWDSWGPMEEYEPSKEDTSTYRHRLHSFSHCTPTHNLHFTALHFLFLFFVVESRFAGGPHRKHHISKVRGSQDHFVRESCLRRWERRIRKAPKPERTP